MPVNLPHNNRWAVYGPLVLAVTTAALLQAIHVAWLPTVSADGIMFVGIAHELEQDPVGTFRRNDQHPGYPALLLAATKVVHAFGYKEDPQSWAAGGVAVSYLAGLGSVVMVWLLARCMFDARVAGIAAVAFACLPVPVWNAGDAHSDVPHAFLYLAAAWLACEAIKSGQVWPWAAAGAASALAYWIRPEGLEVALAAAACVAWQAARSRWTWKYAAAAGGALATAAALVALPYPVLSGKLTSKQLPFAKTQPQQTFINLMAQVESKSPGGQASGASHDSAPANVAAPTASPEMALAQPTADGARQPQALAAGAAASSPAGTVAVTGEPPPRYSFRLVLKLLGRAVSAFLYCIGQGFKIVFVPFYLIGHIECARRKPEWLQVGLLALLGAVHFVVLVCVFLLSGYIAHRHVLPLVGIAMPFAALGVIFAGEQASRRFHWNPNVAVGTLLAVCCAAVVPYSLRAMNREFIPVMDATRWVQEQAPPGSGIVCNSPYVGFYGKLPVAMLDYAAPSLEAALARAQSDARYDYVVLHVNAHGFQPAWLPQIESRYRQVRVFPDPSSIDRPKWVLVFQAKEGHVLRPSGQQPL